MFTDCAGSSVEYWNTPSSSLMTSLGSSSQHCPPSYGPFQLPIDPSGYMGADMSSLSGMPPFRNGIQHQPPSLIPSSYASSSTAPQINIPLPPHSQTGDALGSALASVCTVIYITVLVYYCILTAQ